MIHGKIMIEFCKFNFKLLLKKSARLEKGERAIFFNISYLIYGYKWKIFQIPGP